MASDSSHRNSFLDFVKAVAIYMVVLSHVIGYREGFSHVDSLSYTANFIAMSNMPIFFALSGYFSHGLHSRGFIGGLCRRLLGYFWPMAIFAIVHGIIQGTSIYTFFRASVCAFLFNNWFFYVLALCDISFFVSKKFTPLYANYGFLLVCLLIALTCSGNIWHMSFYAEMFPFYVFGYYLFSLLLGCFSANRIKRYYIPLMINMIAYFAVVFLCGNVSTNGLGFYWEHFNLLHSSPLYFLHYLFRIVVGISGVMSIMFIVHMLMSVSGIICEKVASVVGRRTMQLFFVHGILVHAISNRFCTLSCPTPQLWLWGGGILMLSMLVVLLTERNSAISVIFWGPSMRRS